MSSHVGLAAKAATFLALVGGLHPVAYSQDRQVVFFERSGGWEVAGDPELGACLIKPVRSAYNATELTIVAAGASSHFEFALVNRAWTSLGDGSMRLNATFLDHRGQETDGWSLSATATSAAQGGPRINWSIDRARNDSASFIDQFASSSELWFFRDSVPVAKFDLAGSAGAVAALRRCRTMLRIDDDFDPFAE